MDITPYLRLMVRKRASDLYFSAGTKAGLKIDGITHPVGENALGPPQVRELAYSLLSDNQIREFEATFECNLATTMEGIGRFRINVFRQRGSVAIAIRHIKDEIPSVEDLNLPATLKDLVLRPRGLVLIVGSTGSGKSTSLAAMIDHRNHSLSGHILTIEDPIEFVHRHKRSIVNQREIGLDTLSYENALKNAMREAPDVILIGEIRDATTMQAAIAYAETGHLCLSTLHANNANQALERIINFFPDSAHRQIYMDMSLNLIAVVSQRLLRDTQGGRIPAVEIMLLSAYVAELIKKGEIRSIKDAMEQSDVHGMQTFDQSLFYLYQSGRITLEDALANADSRNDLALRIRLQGTGQPSSPKSEVDIVA